jgi:LysR family glycine cleavage system transcriptional activator
MNHLPSIQTLRAFEAACRLQNYSRVADELGLTHGAISHRIRELEERLGAQLFARQAGKMVPTVPARQLLARIRPALSILENSFETAPSARPRALRISVLPGFAARWLVARLDGFRKAHPQIALNVTADVALADLSETGSDAAIRYGLGDWPGTQSERLGPERLFPVCSPDYRESVGIKEPDDLRGCVLLRHTWQAWGVWLEAAGLDMDEPPDAPVYSESDLLLKAAEAGQGVALARGLLAHDELRSGRLVRLFDIEVPDPYSYFLVWNPRSRCVADVRAFGDWLQEAIRESAGPEDGAPPAIDGDGPRGEEEGG